MKHKLKLQAHDFMALSSILVSLFSLLWISGFTGFSETNHSPAVQMNPISQTDLRIIPNQRNQSAPENLPSRSTVAELHQLKFKPHRFDGGDPFLNIVHIDLVTEHFNGLRVIYFVKKFIAQSIYSVGARAPPLSLS